MELLMSGRNRWLLAALLLFIANRPSLSRAENAPNADEIIGKAVARAQKSQITAAPATYSYTKLTLTEEFDSDGNVKDRKERVYQVFLQGGSTCLKLISVNGHAPSEADLKKQSDNEM